MTRDTRTGRVLEKMVTHSLEHGGYKLLEQKTVGQRLGGGKHNVDIVASREGRGILVSLKWQQSSGTAEQKVPYEYMCLAQTLQEFPDFDAAYIVLGGTGWTKDSFFIEELGDWVNTSQEVRVVRFEDFVESANKGLI